MPDGGRSHAHELDPTHPARPVAVLPVLSAGRRRGRGGGRRDSPFLAEVCPELPDRIVNRLALGPRELEARFGATGGHIFHGELLPGQMLEQRFGPRSFLGVAGLYLAGSGAHPGGAVTGAPGFLAARAVLEDLDSLPDGLARRHRRADPAASTPPARFERVLPCQSARVSIVNDVNFLLGDTALRLGTVLDADLEGGPRARPPSSAAASATPGGWSDQTPAGCPARSRRRPPTLLSFGSR